MPNERGEQILQYIRTHVERNGFPPSVREIGQAVGLRSPATVFRHLRRLQAEGYLTHVDHKRRAWAVAGTPAPATADAQAAPLLGKITAGQPVLAVEHIEDWLPVPRRLFHGRVDFFLRVVGDSMEDAGILDGDVVAVQAQPVAQDGEIVIALLGDEATVKRLRLGSDGPYLVAENPRYPPIVPEDLRILGKVVGLVRSL